MLRGFAAAALTALALAVTCVPAAAAGAGPSNAPRETLRIAAAADLQPVLPALIAQYEKRTGATVNAAYSSSAALAMQIVNGGPFDLFLAADTSFPEKVIAAGLADSAKPVSYARGTLVLWTHKGSSPGKLSLEALQEPLVHKVAVANPRHAPYGRAAMAAIRNAGLMGALQPKLVFAENIAQAAQFADSGNAQAGLISLTAALTPHMEAAGRYVELPWSGYPPILQGAVVLRKGRREQAHAFLNYLLSAPVRKELAARGLKAPE